MCGLRKTPKRLVPIIPQYYLLQENLRGSEGYCLVTAPRTGYIPDLSGLGSSAFIKVELHPFPAQVFLCVCVRVCTQKVCYRLCTTGLGWTGQGGQRTAVAQSLGELGQCSRASRSLRSKCLVQNLILKINVPLFFKVQNQYTLVKKNVNSIMVHREITIIIKVEIESLPPVPYFQNSHY